MHVQVPVAFDNKVLIMKEAVIIYLLVFKNWNTVMLSDLLYISLRVELSTLQNFYLQILSDDVITDILMFSDLF